MYLTQDYGSGDPDADLYEINIMNPEHWKYGIPYIFIQESRIRVIKLSRIQSTLRSAAGYRYATKMERGVVQRNCIISKYA